MVFHSQHAVGLYRVPGHAEVRGNKITDRLARNGSVQQFVRLEPFLGVSRQNIRRKMKRWMEKQHLALWRGLCSTQRQTRELISGPNPAKPSVVIGLLTGHNTLKKHIRGLFKKYRTFGRQKHNYLYGCLKP
jgi:hypothetical protein